MSLIELKVNRISYSQSQNGAYALILEENDVVKENSQSLLVVSKHTYSTYLEKNIEPPRPLTHDLFKKFAKKF